MIGINSAIASSTGFYAGYGFAIPITLAKQVMDDLIKHGKVRRAVLGIAIAERDARWTRRRPGSTEVTGVRRAATLRRGPSESPAEDARASSRAT